MNEYDDDEYSYDDDEYDELYTEYFEDGESYDPDGFDEAVQGLEYKQFIKAMSDEPVSSEPASSEPAWSDEFPYSHPYAVMLGIEDITNFPRERVLFTPEGNPILGLDLQKRSITIFNALRKSTSTVKLDERTNLKFYYFPELSYQLEYLKSQNCVISSEIWLKSRKEIS